MYVQCINYAESSYIKLYNYITSIYLDYLDLDTITFDFRN